MGSAFNLPFFKVTDSWSEANGQQCVDLLVSFHNEFNDFLGAKDFRIHVDNPSWLKLSQIFHAIQVFIHEAKNENRLR